MGGKPRNWEAAEGAEVEEVRGAAKANETGPVLNWYKYLALPTAETVGAQVGQLARLKLV